MQPIAQLGEYQFLEKLGEGGMGAVYKALHTKLKRTVAIKILSKDRLRDQQAVARFEREMEVVGALDHPHIVRAYDAREVEGARFLVMEYVEGLDVSALGRACQPLPIADACEIVRQTALGLQHAHEHGLVHRDIKPSNLMVTPQGVVKLLDLGLARFEHEQAAQEEVTGTGQAMGTIDYMAPEQVSDARSVDIRADIYSLGCTLYKLLVGQTPFGGPKHRTAAARLLAHLSEPVPPVRQFRADVPEPLARVLERMLAKESGQRFAVPAEVADAIGPLAAGSHLAALVARAQGRPVPEALPQAMTATEEFRSSSAYTRLMDEIAAAGSPAAREGPGGRRTSWRQTAMILSMLAVGALCLAALLTWVWSSASENLAGGSRSVPGARASQAMVAKKSYLVLHWPAEEREGAILELDGQAQDMARLELLALGGENKLAIQPGEHKLLIKRLGYEPFEHSFTVTPGEDVTIRPTWKELAVIAKQEGAQPPASPLSRRGRGAGGEGVMVQPPDRAAGATEGTPGKAPPKEKRTAVASPPPETPEAMAARKRQEALEARYAEATKSVEALAAAWDFRGAAVELNKIHFEEAELSARLAQRREELKRMYDLKQKIVAKINAARPPLKKSVLHISGFGGEVTRADEAGLTCKLFTGKSETLGWSQLGGKAMPKLVQLAADPASADDWLAAGLVGLTSQDPTFAEKCFDQARGLGAKVESHLAPLAAAAFAEANALLEKKRFSGADAALASLEVKYATTPWLGAHKKSVESARTAAKAGIHEAETLYAEAAKLFTQKEFFDLKPVIEKLKADYADTPPITDGTRKPSFPDLEKALAKFGKIFTVRLDGKGDFRSIQAAIDKVPPESAIQIEDGGPYAEWVFVPDEKAGLTIRGKKGCWPIITSAGIPQGTRPRFLNGVKDRSDVLVQIRGPRTTIERVVLAHTAPTRANACCLGVTSGTLDLRRAIVYMGAGEGIWSDWAAGRLTLQDSLVLTSSQTQGSLFSRNCLWLGIIRLGAGAGELHFCTVPRLVDLSPFNANVVLDCIVDSVHQPGQVPTDVQRCNLTGLTASADASGRLPESAIMKGCIAADPRFRDPANLDFRLKPGSPCIGKASDGGDIGCHYTPEMIELVKEALELRRRGMIKL